MGNFEPSTDEEIEAGRREGAAQAQNGPRAQAIAYFPATGRFRLELKSGTVLEFSREAVPELDAATDAQLADGLGVSVSGGAIVCRAIDMDIAVEGLVLDLAMGKAWRLGLKQWYASQMGRTKSDAKAEAARANGKKGGRPRRTTAKVAGTGQAS
jgi:hypothetical protein